MPDALAAMTDHMLGVTPLNLQQIFRVDLTHLEPANAKQLSHDLHESVLGPFHSVFVRAKECGQVDGSVDPSLAAASVVALVSGLGFMHLPTGKVSKKARRAAQECVRQGLTLLLEGARPNPPFSEASN